MERTEQGRHDDPLLGRTLDGRYQVEERIARGGMATVYRALDLRLDRPVAVKVMHAGLGEDPDFVARFEREARSAARFSHHNVVSVFDAGDDAGTLYLVMEYVPGLTLRDLIRKEAPMDPGRSLALLEPVLAALAAAHDAGMIHRDVKPENVLLADDGRVKVADFGLARAVSAETQHTATSGILIGTVSYLSPELVVDGKADARADVYAAGVLLYEMLTGHKPHQAESPIQVAYKHVHEDIPPPSERVATLPPYLDALVARATARDRDLRPADARVLLHLVRRVRHAWDHGLLDDPELVADLLPGSGAGTSSTDELDPIVAPVRNGGYVPADVEHTASVEQTSVVFDPPGGDFPPQRPLPRTPSRTLRRRRGVVLLIALLGIALLVALGGWYLGIARYTTTPAVLNLSQAAARTKILGAGLKFGTGDPQYSETVPKGSVISTDPEPGARILKDGTVTAVISLGPERHPVPDLRGKSLADATDALTAAKLSLGTVQRRFNDTVARGLVVSSDPDTGTKLRRNTAVDLVVSRGPRPISIPDWTGKDAKKAEKALSDLGFDVQVQQDFSDTVPAGQVILQTPNTGTGYKGDTIALVVSQGPELVQIPSVRGMRAKDAQKLLEKDGFQVQIQKSSLFVGAQIVVRSDPSEGTMAPRGSLVVLTIV